jgi:GAF domain-containing protein/HAMP domain-containing protein
MNDSRLHIDQNTNEANSPQSTAGRRKGPSVLRRAGLLFLVMILLVGAASGISLWFSNAVEKTTQSMQQATDQAIRISDLQLRWLAIAGILDTFSVTRPTPATREALDKQLADLNTKLLSLTSEPLGLSEEKIAQNRQIAKSLQQTGLDMTALVQELYNLVEQGRWGTALQKRQSVMAGFQATLIENLHQLNANIQSDVSAQVAEISRLQNLARSLSLAVLFIAIVFTFGSIWVARRSILLPIRKLNSDIHQIAQARSAASLRPITPLEQSDEIGELSWSLSRMVDWLRESYETLEKQVEERTRGLQRRRVQIEVAAQIARDIAAMRDLENLLYRSVNLIRDRFDFYHAGIFLIDQRQEYAVLRAATGEAGREMLARGHKLKIGQTGLVGHVAQNGESRVASDVELDEVYFKNPLLRETQSEAALPLKAAGQVIGVLDVQSQEPAAFDEESITTLQIMADQMAIAIQNARLLQESQENLKELETTYGRINRQAWERFVSSSRVVGFEFDGVNTHPILHDQEKLVKDGQGAGSPFSIPLRVRGEVIGTLDVWSQDADLSDADVYLLATISNRISQILESTRLLQEAQRLAWREQQVNTIATQVRNSINLDTILQNTVRELGKSLGSARAFIQIGGNLPIPAADQSRQPGEAAGSGKPTQLEPGLIEDPGKLSAGESLATGSAPGSTPGSNGRPHNPPAATRQGESEA